MFDFSLASARVVSYYKRVVHIKIPFEKEKKMKAQEVEIGSRVQFSEYGSGTHNGTVVSVTGTGGAGIVEITDIEPVLRSLKTTVREMAAMVKPAADCPAPDPKAGKGNQAAIRNYIERGQQGGN